MLGPIGSGGQPPPKDQRSDRPATLDETGPSRRQQRLEATIRPSAGAGREKRDARGRLLKTTAHTVTLLDVSEYIALPDDAIAASRFARPPGWNHLELRSGDELNSAAVRGTLDRSKGEIAHLIAAGVRADDPLYLELMRNLRARLEDEVPSSDEETDVDSRGLFNDGRAAPVNWQKLMAVMGLGMLPRGSPPASGAEVALAFDRLAGSGRPKYTELQLEHLQLAEWLAEVFVPSDLPNSPVPTCEIVLETSSGLSANTVNPLYKQACIDIVSSQPRKTLANLFAGRTSEALEQDGILCTAAGGYRFQVDSPEKERVVADYLGRSVLTCKVVDVPHEAALAFHKTGKMPASISRKLGSDEHSRCRTRVIVNTPLKAGIALRPVVAQIMANVKTLDAFVSDPKSMQDFLDTMLSMASPADGVLRAWAEVNGRSRGGRLRLSDYRNHDWLLPTAGPVGEALLGVLERRIKVVYGEGVAALWRYIRTSATLRPSDYPGVGGVASRDRDLLLSPTNVEEPENRSGHPATTIMAYFGAAFYKLVNATVHSFFRPKSVEDVRKFVSNKLPKYFYGKISGDNVGEFAALDEPLDGPYGVRTEANSLNGAHAMSTGVGGRWVTSAESYVLNITHPGRSADDPQAGDHGAGWDARDAVYASCPSQGTLRTALDEETRRLFDMSFRELLSIPLGTSPERLDPAGPGLLATAIRSGRLTESQARALARVVEDPEYVRRPDQADLVASLPEWLRDSMFLRITPGQGRHIIGELAAAPAALYSMTGGK